MKTRTVPRSIDWGNVKLRSTVQDYLLFGTRIANDRTVFPQGWLTIDIDLKRLRLHDGHTPGGIAEFGNLTDTLVTNKMRLANYTFKSMFELDAVTMYVVKVYNSAWVAVKTSEEVPDVFTKLYAASGDNKLLGADDLTLSILLSLNYHDIDEVTL